MTDQRQAILVLGMHRSGTSALTRILSLCGAGLPATIMPPAAEDNATGFWESEAIVELHDAVLKSMGSSWSDLRTLPRTWFASDDAANFQDQLAIVLDAEYGAARIILVKDPRLCRLLPLWLPVLAAKSIAAKAIIPLRHPLEVAASLHKRENFDTARSTQLWLSHVLTAERDSRGLPRCFVTYDQLLDDWRTVVKKIAASLDLDWPIPIDHAAPEIEPFLSARWRHHTLADASLADASLADASWDGTSPWLGQTYRWMQDAAAGTAPPAGRLDDIGAAIAAAEAMLGPAIGALQREIDRKAAETKHWVDAAVERYTLIEAQRRELDRLSSRPSIATIMDKIRQALVTRRPGPPAPGQTG